MHRPTIPDEARVIAEWRPESGDVFEPSRVLARMADRRVVVGELSGGRATMVSMPLNRAEAQAYAEQVICGDSGALTVPGGLMALASAYYALCLTVDAMRAGRAEQ